ncbi:MAG: Sir2 family NAD-dependent protein deacetylase [Acidimicrobiales bacterium]
MDHEIEQARARLHAARRVVVLTGAGISTDSGIPDFRGPRGVWTRDPVAEKASHIDHYLGDRSVRVLAWRGRTTSPAWTARPNSGHRALVDLERSGRLHCLITQNVDGLHQAAGSDPNRVVEVHGTMREAACLSCGVRMPMEHALERVRAGEEDPACRICGGILKSATISFGQSLVPEDLVRAEQAARTCDLLLAVGSTLSVFPIAEVVPLAIASGASAVIVNAEPTAMDGMADVVVRGPIGEVLPSLVAGIQAVA